MFEGFRYVGADFNNDNGYKGGIRYSTCPGTQIIFNEDGRPIGKVDVEVQKDKSLDNIIFDVRFSSNRPHTAIPWLTAFIAYVYTDHGVVPVGAFTDLDNAIDKILWFDYYDALASTHEPTDEAELG